MISEAPRGKTLPNAVLKMPSHMPSHMPCGSPTLRGTKNVLKVTRPSTGYVAAPEACSKVRKRDGAGAGGDDDDDNEASSQVKYVITEPDSMPCSERFRRNSSQAGENRNLVKASSVPHSDKRTVRINQYPVCKAFEASIVGTGYSPTM